MVNYIIRVIRFGLPSRAVAPFILGVCRLIWLGHLVPTQLQKLSQAGAELCSSGNIYLAQENSLESLGLSHEILLLGSRNRNLKILNLIIGGCNSGNDSNIIFEFDSKSNCIVFGS